MKLASISFVFLALTVISTNPSTHVGASEAIQVVGPIEDVSFGALENTPNGHVSFQKLSNGYRLWLPGRLDDGSDLGEEGGFRFDLHGWTLNDQANGEPFFALGPENPGYCVSTGPDKDLSFDRNYGAINAVIPGAESGTLLAFYDAEFHINCPNGSPLLSSIGSATSTDGGVTWQKQGQAIEGLDEADKGFCFVTQKQMDEVAAGNDHFDIGASGPSAVIRDDNGTEYIYLYYADRTPILGTPDSIYVARAALSTDGLPGSWQKWNGTDWGSVGDQKPAQPVITPTDDQRAALQPHVSFNTALGLWLIVFKTHSDFEIATSGDGVNWNASVPLLTFDPTDRDDAFPTLISPHADGCDTNCTGGPVQPSQQVTGATGWLYYSTLPAVGPHYIGHRVRFAVMENGN